LCCGLGTRWKEHPKRPCMAALLSKTSATKNPASAGFFVDAAWIGMAQRSFSGGGQAGGKNLLRS
jgi:hypothetical protein